MQNPDTARTKRIVGLWFAVWLLTFPAVWMTLIVPPYSVNAAGAVFIAGRVVSGGLAAYSAWRAVRSERAGLAEARFGWLPAIVELGWWIIGGLGIF